MVKYECFINDCLSQISNGDLWRKINCNFTEILLIVGLNFCYNLERTKAENLNRRIVAFKKKSGHTGNTGSLVI